MKAVIAVSSLSASNLAVIYNPVARTGTTVKFANNAIFHSAGVSGNTARGCIERSIPSASSKRSFMSRSKTKRSSGSLVPWSFKSVSLRSFSTSLNFRIPRRRDGYRVYWRNRSPPYRSHFLSASTAFLLIRSRNFFSPRCPSFAYCVLPFSSLYLSTFFLAVSSGICSKYCFKVGIGTFAITVER